MKVQLQALQARHPAATVGSRPALDDISFSLERGEQVAVIGPSGAGKTTLLQVMSCGLPPSAGTLQIDGVDPWGLTTAALQKLRGRLFLAPQVPPLPPRQRVVTAVLAGRLPAMGLWQSLRSLLYPVDLEAAHAALSHLDLADKMFERVDRLSGGERQRVALARALLAPATLWMVDEPLSALDPARARLVMRTLTEQARSQGITLVATLHQVESALLFFHASSACARAGWPSIFLLLRSPRSVCRLCTSTSSTNCTAPPRPRLLRRLPSPWRCCTAADAPCLNG